MVEIPAGETATINAIETAVEQSEHRDFDHVVRASSIGGCDRHLFYKFRWAHKPESFDGRKLRLFNTGHVEEDRMVAWLKLAGATVLAVDPDTGEQWEVVALDGHFKGHLDGVLTDLKEAPKTPHLLECKTHNTKSFASLKKHGVEVSKPEHVAQMQIYMHLKNLTRAFYLAKNKDNDELYAERIKYDAAHAIAIMAKAELIRDANNPPPRISDKPDYFLCKAFQCVSYGNCWGDRMALRNCRTCLHSDTIANGKWHCQRNERDLNLEDQRAGCSSHLYLPCLVPGEQIDVDEAKETVTYKMRDGRTWIDG